MIEVGQKIPDVKVKTATEAGQQEASTAELFKGKKAVVFGVPGAFTPTCSSKHLPGYVAQYADLKGAGVDLVACVSVNDAFVMEAWGKAHDALGKVVMVADGSGALTKAMGLELDLTGAHMGVRCKRWAAVVEDGVVKSIDVDDKGLVDTACEAQLKKV